MDQPARIYFSLATAPTVYLSLSFELPLNTRATTTTKPSRMRKTKAPPPWKRGMKWANNICVFIILPSTPIRMPGGNIAQNRRKKLQGRRIPVFKGNFTGKRGENQQVAGFSRDFASRF
jgi:hypothetical protein